MDEREQEKVLGRLLARNLRQHLEPGGADCPDADLLAAYTERSLGDAETSRLEAHFTVCGRCQEALAALVLSEGAPSAVTEEEFAPAEEREAAAMVAAIADLRATVPPPPATPAMKVAPATRPAVLGSPDYVKPKRRFWSVRWLAPAVAAAATVLLWIGLRPTLLQRSTPATPLETESASAPPETTSSEAPAEPPKELAQNAPTPSPAEALESRVQAPAGEASRMPSKETAAKPRVAQAPEKLQSEAKTLSAERTGPQMMDQKRAPARGTAGIAAASSGGISGEKGRADRALQPQGKEIDTTSAAATKPGGAVTHTSEVTQAPEKEREGKLEKKSAAVATGAAPTPSPPAGKAEEASKKAADIQGGAPPQQYRAAIRQKMAFPPTQVTITTPNPSVIWRVGVAGQIELSRDSGRTWTGQVSNVSVDLAAGFAPSETVCWVVGRAGTVLRTIDGEHWEKLSPPTTTDLIRVKAPDALHASVVAADQQRYITADGGKTWRASTE